MKPIDGDALKDVINRNAYPLTDIFNSCGRGMFLSGIVQAIDEQPTVEMARKTRQLTDDEKRIFLKAMDREKEICKKIDEQSTNASYENSLTKICREIERKVKSALWH